MLEKASSWVRYHLSPFFLSKHYLTRDIKAAVRKHRFAGSLLDVGCGSQPYRDLFVLSEYKGIDFPDYSVNKHSANHAPDYFFDDKYVETSRLPFEDGTFRNAACFQVLEHHPEPAKLISEMFRIVEPGGLILVTFPLLWGIHEEPDDFQRYTKYGFLKLVKGYPCEVLEAKEEGSIFSTISLLLGEHLDSIAKMNRPSYYMSALLLMPLLFLEYASLPLDRVFRSKKIFFNYMFVLRKS
jgi:SAM-dependent methyltransferase